MNNIISNPKVIAVLHKHGWSPERSVKSDEWMTDRLRLLDCHDAARLTLNSLFGIELILDQESFGSAPIEKLRFSPSLFPIEMTRYWRSKTGIELYPLGEADDQLELLIDTDGVWYIGNGCLWLAGRDADEAMLNLLFGISKWEKIWKPPSGDKTAVD